MMLNVQSAFSKLLFRTARLECELQGGGRSTGTAFFFHYRVDEQRTIPLLVTNKHVVRGARVRQFHRMRHCQMRKQPSPSGTSFLVTLSDWENSWFMHPANDVDMCVMPFERLRQQAEAQGKVVFTLRIEASRLRGFQFKN